MGYMRDDWRDGPAVVGDPGGHVAAVTDRREFLLKTGRTGFALAAGSTLVAIGCGDDDDAGAGSSAGGGGSDAKVTKVGFDHPYNFVPYVSDVQRYMRKFAEQNGDEVIFTADEGKLEKQVANLTTWIAQEVPAIIAFPLEPKTVERLAESAREKGIVWVSYASEIENQDSSVLFENRKGGELLASAAADFVNEVHGGRAKILQLTFPDGGQLGRDRDESITQTLKQKLPNSEIVAQQKGTVTEEGLAAAQATLGAHPDLSVVIAMSDDSALGAYRALIEAGHAPNDPKVWVGGMDGSRGALELVKKGTMYRASSALLVEELARACLEHPLDVANGGSKAPRVVPVKLLTNKDKSDLDRYLAQLSKA
jgi:ABC-type sugar transport system substrate-binding protein